jgi:hypothetical protein
MPVAAAQADTEQMLQDKLLAEILVQKLRCSY